MRTKQSTRNTNPSKDVTLRNVLFPVWMLLLFPTVWLIILPGNFLIDSLVLILAMAAFKMTERKQFYKRSILKIFGFGLLADVIGSAVLFLLVLLEISQTADEIYLTAPAVVLAAALIFIFNYFVTFRKLEAPLRRKLALTFAIATAPYTFMIPIRWLYF